MPTGFSLVVPRHLILLAVAWIPLIRVMEAPALAAPSEKVPAAIELKAEMFPLGDVRVLSGPFESAELTDKKYLLSLDPERLLHSFPVTAGLPSSAQPLGGWEKPDCEVRGHSVGHYLSACAMMYASTGDPELKLRSDYMVAEFAKCQAAMPSQGYNPGYLAAFPESFFDRVERSQPVWAPYYTLHKIMAGLLDTYHYCDNPQALEVLTRMADWLKFRVDRLSTEQLQRALENEHGGINEVLANLYAVTGNPDHLKLAQAFNHERVFGPLAAGRDELDGLHANTQIPKITGAARQYELTGDPRMHDIAEFFWQRVALHRSYVIGGDSDREHFFPVTQFGKHLSPETAETCNTYNMLKLTRHLFSWEPSACFMDFYERGLYNQILGSQDPDTGMVTYFVPLQAGRFKTYSTPLDSFWCCLGTGMENHAKYADTIYSHGSNTLFVNLFIPSRVQWVENGMSIEQLTDFPEKEMSVLKFDCAQPTEMTLQIRYPAWAEGMTVRVNGRKQTVNANPGSYVTVQRTWRRGDKVEFRLPMRLRIERLPGDPSQVAFLYGPIVLAGERGTEALPPNEQEAKDQLDFAKMTVPAALLLREPAEKVLKELRPVHARKLQFRLKSAGGLDATLVPLYLIHHERYQVYWKVAIDTAEPAS